MEWLYLALAIIFELTGTTLLKISDGWTKPLPVAGLVVSYALCFWLLSLALRRIELGVTYAIWSAVGIVILTLVGIFFFKESATPAKLLSILLIIIGVVGLNLSSTAQ